MVKPATTTVATVTEAIRETLGTSPPRNVPAWRALRRGWSRELESWPARDVIRLGLEVMDVTPWGRVTAYEIIACHPGGIEALTPRLLYRLGEGLADWAGVDTFGCYLAGPAWREGRLSTRDVHRWLRSSDRWQRRAAVVCTVALNVRARGGRGDAVRTLDVCRRVVADRDDMVVKALSWALRSLVRWDRDAVAAFVREHDAVLAARVRREVGTMLRTGRKRMTAHNGSDDRLRRPGPGAVRRTARR
ncbi:MAG: DNA alkylation repair protein [Vicinamibacterales bacterium]